MFLNNLDDLKKVSGRVQTAIFVLPRELEFLLPQAFVLKPEEKSVITIEQVRDLIQRLDKKQINDQFIIIRPAELMNEESANAFLKNLEEPNEKVHFILITDNPSSLLPTILSRAEMYFLREPMDFKEISADEKIRELAKRLMAASGSLLIEVVEEITKKKEGIRLRTLEILGVAIEMLYKSYFLTNKEIFLKKIPKFLKAYEAVYLNGNVKLQLIANLC